MQIKEINKKGQTLGGLGGGIIAVVVSIIILVLGIVVLQSLRDTDTLKKANFNTHTNDSVGNVTELGRVVDNSPGCEIVTLGLVIKEHNATYVINAANYSYSGCTIRYVGAVNAQVNNTGWNVTYTYTSGDEAYASTNTSISGVGDFADFIPMIVLALAAAVIIGLILAGFAFSRGDR